MKEMRNAYKIEVRKREGKGREQLADLRWHCVAVVRFCEHCRMPWGSINVDIWSDEKLSAFQDGLRSMEFI
jgi:hypothetical protein